ncbi:MAG: hypothetical protein AB7I18_08775 [Candidatus Berkiella sp.]
MKTFDELLILIDSLEEFISIMRMRNLYRAGKYEADEECAKAEAELAQIKQMIVPGVKEFKQHTAELINLRRYYYQEIATIGTAPETVHLGLSDEFSLQRMLAKMREIVDGPYVFDKIFYNCSTVVREIMAAGLSQSLKTSDCQQHLFDTPLKIHRFACQLQAQLINWVQRQFTPLYENTRPQPVEEIPLPRARPLATIK